MTFQLIGNIDDLSDSEIVSAEINVINLLILYTSAVKTEWENNVKDIFNLVVKGIYDANISFINSNIAAKVQLVYLGKTNYNESNSSFKQDNDRLAENGDGYLDEVKVLRERYSADICILLVDDDDLCDRAHRIGADAQQAFCTVYANFRHCSTFPHGFHAAKGSNVYIGIQHFPCDGLAPAILRSKEHKAEEPKENGNSFSEPSVSELSISPNPTNGVLRITASESLRSIVLYNLNGEKVLSTTTEVLELYGLPCGMYILQAQTADGNLYQEKVIKQ
ncbi:MAG: T9SS type A sorting domain-containing protein [Paludibacter sp.]|nr:T9SS type A sorting domain-containing protein [Bacteroidales bacterium]MCM1069371.1 T9SS type A sorting domain-containing protein [Prevotella sp.]MCM1353891.1 T9SS type A sorting domain-containing protein [Bacteroides sp.]MCM1442859.1 T9SS type A sorting domain-containing protein [Muribaculum sp.]MCM1481904.1 T9SS type A sorting domain-containing protein [Paludibacter sp.]